jgi:hypothetical protein
MTQLLQAVHCTQEFVRFIGARPSKVFTNLKNTDLSLVVTYRYFRAFPRPLDLVQSPRTVITYIGRGAWHLRVLIQVPEVKLARAINTREQGRVYRRPAHVKHILAITLECMKGSRIALLTPRIRWN